MRTALLGAALAPLLVACASGPARDPDYGRPFEIVASSYAVPAAAGIVVPDLLDGWDDGVSLKRWIQGWTRRPVPCDRDSGLVNYVLHPLSGSETHVMARDHGWTFGEALLFDAFGSLSWEFVVENLFEPPSRTDLLTTAPIGALIGELRYQLKLAGVFPGLMDPFGSFYVADTSVRLPGLDSNKELGLFLSIWKVEF